MVMACAGNSVEMNDVLKTKISSENQSSFHLRYGAAAMTRFTATDSRMCADLAFSNHKYSVFHLESHKVLKHCESHKQSF